MCTCVCVRGGQIRESVCVCVHRELSSLSLKMDSALLTRGPIRPGLPKDPTVPGKPISPFSPSSPGSPLPPGLP